jgi:hypothetical protein
MEQKTETWTKLVIKVLYIDVVTIWDAFTPNVVAEWLKLLLLIRKVPDSNLSARRPATLRFSVVFISSSRPIPGK